MRSVTRVTLPASTHFLLIALAVPPSDLLPIAIGQDVELFVYPPQWRLPCMYPTLILPLDRYAHSLL